jgi:hypothetical protein
MTASEPLSIEEEYQMQQTWFNDAESLYYLQSAISVKLFQELTFIIISQEFSRNRIGPTAALGGMIGDVNLFFNADYTSAELEVMIAGIFY